MMRNSLQSKKVLTYLVIVFAVVMFGYLWKKRRLTTPSTPRYQNSTTVDDQPLMPTYIGTILNGGYDKESTSLVRNLDHSLERNRGIGALTKVMSTNVSTHALKQWTMVTKKHSVLGLRTSTQKTSTESGKHSTTPATSKTPTMESSSCSSINCSGKSESYPTFFTGHPKARLGNQLFIYATIVGLAAHYNTTPIIQPHYGIIKVFKIPHVSNITVLHARNIRTSCCKFVKLPDAEGRQNWTISGFAQSWKFFANVSKPLRRSLQFREHILQQARGFLTNRTKKGSTLVGIHVRRGDLVRDDKGRTVAGPGYIKRAQDFFRSKFSNVQFVVVSNDHKWCKANVTGSDVVHSSFTDAGTDLALLALCDHVIMTVGTFGWWGAWLSNGIGVYYKDYLRPGSEIFRMTVKEDFYMPNWIAMS